MVFHYICGAFLHMIVSLADPGQYLTHVGVIPHHQCDDKSKTVAELADAHVVLYTDRIFKEGDHIWGEVWAECSEGYTPYIWPRYYDHYKTYFCTVTHINY